jgi:hypothetical protein
MNPEALVSRAGNRLWLLSACVRNELPTRRPSLGERGVWLGGVPLEFRWRKLQQKGVDMAIALTAEFAPPGWIRASAEVHWFPVPDRHSPSFQQFGELCTHLDAATRAKRNVLLYCGAGRGRAPTAYAAWLIWRGAEVSQALAQVRQVRRVSKPTGAQFLALRQWSEEQKSRRQ